MPIPRDPHNDYADERRGESRFGRSPHDDYAAVWMENAEPLLAEVYDESLHGIRLVLDGDCDIGIGRQVHIVYAGMCHLAVARHVETRPGGGLLIGFQCEPLPDVTLPR